MVVGTTRLYQLAIFMSTFFALGKSDFVKGAIVAVLGAVFAVLAQAFDLPGFDYATFDWGSVGQAAVTALIAYLSKNFLTTKDGSFMGVL